MDKLTKVIELLTLLKSAVPLMPKLPSMPKHKSLTPPPMSQGSAKGLPGVAQGSKKDPKKVAEQLKAGQQPMKPKLAGSLIKFDQNGQWKLEE